MSNLEVMEDADANSVFKAVSTSKKTPLELQKLLERDGASASELPINTYKKKVVGLFVEFFSGGF